ncbi:MAG: hypothetical protein M1835_006394 [Candelina submexicana]|nr:MAG: hypothetical protein M1835_006394 [Candelina submexicana]
MNLYSQPKDTLSSSADFERLFESPVLDHEELMGDNEVSATSPDGNGLDAHRDARAIVRMIQCTQCSHPLTNPTTLPCGNSLCRHCLPQLHQRENISYPDTPIRQQGFICPFDECQKEHSLDDCNLDVTMAKVMDVVTREIERYRPLASDTPTLLEEIVPGNSISEPLLRLDGSKARILHGGRLISTYTLTEMGELHYDSDLIYRPLSHTEDHYQHLDSAILERLKEACRNELDCQVCYATMLDPLTTSCGHTFCRKCLTRVLDHSNICPICRRLLPMPQSLASQSSNRRLTSLLNGLCPDLMASRAETAANEEMAAVAGMNVSLFVCACAFPSVPTFLHIFEPRYRLMIRRAMESGDRKFGMLPYNRSRQPQGDLGVTQFMEYGTLLHIVSVEMMPDGRSLIEAVGVSRFRVKDWGLLDGYTVGVIERIDDMSLQEEERLEALETSPPVPIADDLVTQLDRCSTRQLLEICVNFIARMRSNSAPWLHEHVLAAYGHPPDDAATFPFWFASVLPIAEEEKYRLMPSSSVRERLKVTAHWVKSIEAQRW